MTPWMLPLPLFLFLFLCLAPPAGRLITLAERIERESRTRRPIDLLLVELCGVVTDYEWQANPADDRPDPTLRLRRVIDQLRRDVSSGRVRSISGLTHEARRLALELDAAAPAPV